MKVWNTIIDFLVSNNKFIELERLNSPVYINLLSSFSLFILASTAIPSLFEEGKPIIIGIQLLTIALLLINLIILRNFKKDKLEFAGNFLLGILSFYFLSGLLLGDRKSVV